MSWRNLFYYVAGLVFLALAKVKHVLHGYTSPKPLDLSAAQDCVDYDIAVVDGWLHHVARYTADEDFHKSRRVLELGPGSDLGIGMYLLAQGCQSYSACDVNDLMSSAPSEFYDAMLTELDVRKLEVGSVGLRPELDAARRGGKSSLNYVVRDDFDLVEAFGTGTIDLVLSQAAFEHFDDLEQTVRGLTQVCRPGTVIAAEIDLKTHSRWIRDVDPNNIYRYPQWLYSAFGFRGSPSRLRPSDYTNAFAQSGWTNIEATPLETVGDEPHHTSGMSGQFCDDGSEMETLTLMLCATLPVVV